MKLLTVGNNLKIIAEKLGCIFYGIYICASLTRKHKNKIMTTLDYKALNNAATNGTIKDSVNPIFILSMTANELLTKIVSGEIDVVELAKYELANRGYDNNGKWVGFKN